MAVHVARVNLMYVTQVGTIKTHAQMTIAEAANASQEHRVIVDAALPNTAGNPTVDAYLALEDNDSFTLNHLDQTYCITYS